MMVHVQFFAQFRRLTGTDKLDLEIAEPATVGQVVEEARKRYPALREFARSTLIAKGLEFAEPGDAVSDGDEISLMPPVMGG